MSLFFRLPVDLVFVVSNEWLGSLTYICNLDSAFCNYSERSLLENSFINNCHAFDSQAQNSVNFYSWISKRRLTLGSLCFPFNFSVMQNLGPSLPGIRESLRKAGEVKCIKMKFDDSVLLFLDACNVVRSLDLSNSQIMTDDHLNLVLEKVIGLQSLTLNNCINLSQTACLSIANNCPDLTSIDFDDWSANNVDLNAVVNLFTTCKKLSKISVDKTFVNDDTILSIAHNCPSLQHLDLTLSSVSDVALTAVALHCPLLEHLMLYYCRLVSDVSVVKIAENCPSLKFLNVLETRNVTNLTVLALARHCPRLTALIMIGSADAVTDEGVCALARGCSQLQDLCLDGCATQLTDVSVLELANRCIHLEEVGFMNCELVTDYALSHMIDKCKKLRVLGAHGTQQIMSTALKAVTGAQCVTLTDEEDYQRNIRFGTRFVGGADLRCVTFDTCASMERSLSESFLRTVSYVCPCLLAITFEKYWSLTDELVELFLTLCPTLTSITLRECPLLTGHCLEVITEHCVNIQELELGVESLKKGNTSQDVLMFNFVYARGAQMKHLNLSDCTTLSAGCIVHITNYCLNLLSLSLNQTPVSDASLAVILDSCNKLTRMSVKNCQNLSAEMKARAALRFPKCV